MVPETNKAAQTKEPRSLGSMIQHTKEGALLYVNYENKWLHLQLLLLTGGYIVEQCCK